MCALLSEKNVVTDIHHTRSGSKGLNRNFAVSGQVSIKLNSILVSLPSM